VTVSHPEIPKTNKRNVSFPGLTTPLSEILNVWVLIPLKILQQWESFSFFSFFLFFSKTLTVNTNQNTNNNNEIEITTTLVAARTSERQGAALLAWASPWEVVGEKGTEHLSHLNPEPLAWPLPVLPKGPCSLEKLWALRQAQEGTWSLALEERWEGFALAPLGPLQPGYLEVTMAAFACSLGLAVTMSVLWLTPALW